MGETALVGDPRFFRRAGPFTLPEVAAAIGAAPPAAPVASAFLGVAPLQIAGPGEISFLDNRRYLPELRRSAAGAVIVAPAHAAQVPAGAVALVTPEPYLAWARACALFHPAPPPTPGVHATAVIDPTAKVDPGAEVGPFCVIGARAEIAAGCRIGPHAVIGDGVVLGRDCRVGAHASVSHALLGARVYLYPGARIGQEGFGFAITATGFVTVPQLGRVVICDDVEIGANSTVDRGAGHDTVIGAGSRLDNLVQIGHNVQLGRCCVIAAMAGVSGSSVLEDFVMAGGQAGVAGHVRVGRKARLGAQAGIMADVPAGADVIGSPAMPIREFFHTVATLRRLAAARRGRAEGGATHSAPEGPAEDRTRSR